MLNISTVQPQAWTSSPPVAVAPVSAAQPVGPVDTARESRADTGRGDHGRSPSSAQTHRLAQRPGSDASGDSTTAQAAPLLPRGQGEGPDRSHASEGITSQELKEQRRQEERDAAEEVARQMQWQDVLSTVWKASAAVVDRALRQRGDDARSNSAVAGAEASTFGPDTPSVAGGHAVLDSATEWEAAWAAAMRREQEPVTYTEQGESAWQPLLTGHLVNQRV
jgi:hypothetical protein